MLKKFTKTNVYFALIIFNIIQEFICLILFNIGVNRTIIKGIYYIKEIMIIVIGFIPILIYFHNILRDIFSRRIVKKFDLAVIMFTLLILGYSILGLRGYSLFTVLMSSRSYLLPILLIAIGIDIVKKNGDIENKVYYYIKIISLILIFTTIVERIFFSVSLWQTLDLVNYNKVIKGIDSWSKNSLIINFYSAGMRRAIGTMGDPLVVSYFSVPLLYYNYFYWNNSCKLKSDRRNCGIIAILLLIVQIMTLTRAIILSELVSIVIIQIINIFRRRVSIKRDRFVLGYFAVILFSIIIVVKYGNFIIATVTLSDGSALTHQMSFMQGLENSIHNIMGLGVGYGSLAAGATGNENLQTEVAVFNLITDAGIISFFMLCLIFKYTCSICNKINIYKTSEIAKTIIYSSMTYLITSFLSPQIWAMKSVILYWGLVGVCRGLVVKRNKEVM